LKNKPNEIVGNFIFTDADELGHTPLGVATNAVEDFIAVLLATLLGRGVPRNKYVPEIAVNLGGERLSELKRMYRQEMAYLHAFHASVEIFAVNRCQCGRDEGQASLTEDRVAEKLLKDDGATPSFLWDLKVILDLLADSAADV
jgi:hypothetical protein